MSKTPPDFTITAIQVVFGAEREARMRRAFDVILGFSLDDENEAASDSVSQARPLAAHATPPAQTGETHKDTSK